MCRKDKPLYYNGNAQDLPALSERDTMRMKPFTLGKKEWKKGVSVERLDKRSNEVERADGSSYRLNRVRLKWTNELLPGLTIGEPPKPRLMTQRIRRNQMALRRPHRLSPARKHLSQDPLRTTVKRPAYLKDFVT